MNVDIQQYLKNFLYANETKTIEKELKIGGNSYPIFINQFWTAKQRQAKSIHEISYRACFKAQLPAFFINLLTKENDTVYDPFSGRGTTLIEAALLNRDIVANDINPLSRILSYPRLFIPNISDLIKRLNEIPLSNMENPELDLSMFFHQKTLSEILSLKNYLHSKRINNNEDKLDLWIRMVATNRLTGHSKGFFSVYTLPPNQAVSIESQRKINRKKDQDPEYRNTKELIIRKTKSLLRNLTNNDLNNLRNKGEEAVFLTNPADKTPEIKDDSIALTITSPPFLNIVQYDKDNWLRCWFNRIEMEDVISKVTITNDISQWCNIMEQTFGELFRITRQNGWVAFEVGEIRKKKMKLEEFIVPIGIKAGFDCEAIMINQQDFTKTSNIWGIKNNELGTNTNRIVLFRKKNRL